MDSLTNMAGTATVVIPARNAAHHLGRCLVAIEAQRQAVRQIIVVDDGSSDDTAAVARSHGATVLRSPGRGPAAARNVGARAATGDVVVFLDADCVPRPGCLEALLQPFADPSVAGVRGAYATRQRSPVARFVQLEFNEKQQRLASAPRVTVVDTACAAYRRSVFDRHHGFDETFGATTAEDVELSFRLAAAGERMVYAAGALVDHTHPEHLGRYCWRKLRFGCFRALVYRRFPERMAGDGYTPRSMLLQIACAALLLLALVAGYWLRPALWLAAAAGLGFLAAATPLLAGAWRSDRSLVPLVLPMALLRSLSQGFGLAAGFALLLLGPSRRRAASTTEPPAPKREARAAAVVQWVGAALSLLSVALLVILLRQSGWQALLEPISSVRVGWLLAAALLALAVEIVKSVRWGLLLGPDRQKFGGLFAAVLTSRLMNALTPFRAGDLWRVAAAARGAGRPIVLAGGSVVAEKVLDGLALALISLALLGTAASRLPLSLILAAALLLPGLALVAILQRWLPASWLVRLRPWLSSLAHLRGPRLLLAAGALTAAGMAVGVLVNIVVLQALGLSPALLPALVMLIGGYAAGAVPAGPGRLAVFEAAVAGPLVSAGLDPGRALIAAIGLHVALLASLVLGGLIALPVGLGRRRPRPASTSPAVDA